MLQDARTRAIVAQAALVSGLVVLVLIVGLATARNLEARGIPLGFGFLFNPASFQIAETILPYAPSDPNWWAATVGLANSLFVSAVVIVVSSIIGLFIGIGRLSHNPLLRGLCRTWVEVARNTPLVVLLIFVYALCWKVLPPAAEAWTLAPGTHLSIRGLATPAIRWWGPALAPVIMLAMAILLILLASRLAARQQAKTGRRPPFVPQAWGAVILCALVLPLLFRSQLSVDFPVFERANFKGGWSLTPELTTILTGLTFYTAGFIGEIVRGGIVSVRKGQWEAATALGLTRAQTYRLIVVPLALRGIVPPLNSQYINVVKNSTLAIVVGFQDFMTVVGTIINKTSHAVEGIALILGVFLVVNLGLSAVLNAYNRRIALVER
jgi:general L-amino acid transport system permease protein